MNRELKIPRRLVALWGTLAIVCAATWSGCSGKSSPYPEAQVKSPLGRPSVCASCKRQIANVGEGNLITVKGVRYTVCSEKCAKALEKWAMYQ